jgi:hypothetical protein
MNNNKSYRQVSGGMFVIRLFLLAVFGFGAYAGLQIVAGPGTAAFLSRVFAFVLAIPAVILAALILRAIGSAFAFHRLHRKAVAWEQKWYGEKEQQPKPGVTVYEDPAKLKAKIEKEHRQAADKKFKEDIAKARNIPDERERAAAIAKVRREYQA